MKRIVVHWTGGSYEPSAYERTRYHSFTTGDGEFVEGDKPPEANSSPLGPDYVRHTGGGNSDAIGHALCGMGGRDVTESPLNLGSYPIRREQFAASARHLADYCQIYNIPPVPGRLETHAEFHKRTGVGRYKWDITALEGSKRTMPPEAIGDELRRMVRAELDKRKAPTKNPFADLIAAIIEVFQSWRKS